MRVIFILSLHFIAIIFAMNSAEAKDDWPVIYDAEKGSIRLAISREPHEIDDYTKRIPAWNEELNDPETKIVSAEVTELAKMRGLRVLKVQLALTDAYYTDVLMLLAEIIPGRFLPVYVQDYERTIRFPSATTIVTKTDTRVVITTGIDYVGSGALHERYKITLAPNQIPVVTQLPRK